MIRLRMIDHQIIDLCHIDHFAEFVNPLLKKGFFYRFK